MMQVEVSLINSKEFFDLIGVLEEVILDKDINKKIREKYKSKLESIINKDKE